ncbi:acyl carrier protein [Starkeya sp. ORNL1]|uniref:acyl carrier protein n=1 Tax=Starkeya sp. ORNL1 TaxID=2709380 RepID=UPI001463788F|nr:acyl carrier protein [Starkeya sp. ORNL1]QJP16162.1 acyl carrier protein [Starkeya sp. ORNL1]
MTDKLTEIFAMTLNLPEDSISDATSPDNTEAWDSLANMLLIAAIEETFEIELHTSEIETMKNVGKVRAVLEKRQVALV